MTRRASGHCGVHIQADAAFSVHLGPNTSVSFVLSGKLGGTINGMAISGHGSLEYTYRQGAAAWELEVDGLAQGPQLPSGALVYLPSNASGSATVATNGTMDVTGAYSHGKDKYHFKLKGRTASITVNVVQDTVQCDLSQVIPGSTDCASAFPGDQTCIDQCIAAGGL